jgi:predicted nucleic acid-binding protein
MADYLLDTNVLLRFSDAASPVHATAVDAVAVLLSRGDRVYITAQNLIEFWAVATSSSRSDHRIRPPYPFSNNSPVTIPNLYGL